MIVVGGASYSAEGTLDYLVPDPWPQGIGVYDLSALEWKTAYDADAEPYVTPDIIKQYYQANGSEPAEWTDEGVKAWFQSAQRVENGETSSGSSGNTSNNNDSNNDSNSTSGDDENNTSTNTGAIAGGVVGGVAALALLGGIIWFVLRRRRQRQGAHHQGTVYSPAAAHEEGAMASEYRGKEGATVGEMDGSGRMSELPAGWEGVGAGEARGALHELPSREEPGAYR